MFLKHFNETVFSVYSLMVCTVFKYSQTVYNALNACFKNGTRGLKLSSVQIIPISIMPR